MREDERLFQKANDTAMGRGVVQDYYKAADLCKKAADQGNMQAKFVIIASRYEPFRPTNHDVSSDEVVPFRYLNYRKMFDPLTPVSREEAMQTLRECAEYGIPEAQFLMSKFTEDIEEQNFWEKKAADNGVLPAMRRRQSKAKFNGDNEEATHWKIRVFIAEGEKDRMKVSMDGTISPEYADWLINAPDDFEREENRKYYRIAAEAGYAEAQVKMANTYNYDDPEYLYWMQKAGEQDNCNACEYLMDLYARDDEPIEKYLYWTKKGADQGDVLLQEYFADYSDRKELSSGVENAYYDPEEAMKYFLLAAKGDQKQAEKLRAEAKQGRKNNE